MFKKNVKQFYIQNLAICKKFKKFQITFKSVTPPPRCDGCSQSECHD